MSGNVEAPSVERASNATQCSDMARGLRTEDTFQRTAFNVAYPGGVLYLGGKTHVMGILNVTTDSFYDGKRYYAAKDAVNHGLTLAAEGADIIDVGGESTRPGAHPASEADELKRVIPVVKALSKQIKIPISIDTYKAAVAEKAIDAGASIINDISGLTLDKRMAAVAAAAKVPIIIMHKKGTPKTMQRRPMRSKRVLPEILSYLKKSIAIAIKNGIESDKIILDPGIGFGKTALHNLEILKGLKELDCVGFPLLIGTSRKNFIRTILNVSVQDSLYGTLATVAIAAMNGAHIVRVHDVRAAVQVVAICDAVMNQLP
ncbi:MAG: dihydropteroate synthase [Planctomycetota bacterium]